MKQQQQHKMNIYWLKVKDIIQETREIKTFLLERPKDFTWEPGAHTHFALKGFNALLVPNRSLVRHMSISTLPSEDAIGITTRIREQCSKFKSIIRKFNVGDEAAIFKTHCNIPLRREGRAVYLLSSGVGLATFRPIALDYLGNPDGIQRMHSLNVESNRQYLFQNIFRNSPENSLSAQFVDNRAAFYEEARKLTEDKDGLFYVVGSDEFLRQNIDLLRANGIPTNQIMIDKRKDMQAEFLP